MRPHPLIVCRDVEASRQFYVTILGCRSAHGGDEYDRLVDPRVPRSEWGTEGLILQLHARDEAHHHGILVDGDGPLGRGVLIWFEVDDFPAAVARARAASAPVVQDVHRNPNANHEELWLRDPDGYTVVLSSVTDTPAP